MFVESKLEDEDVGPIDILYSVFNKKIGIILSSFCMPDSRSLERVLRDGSPSCARFHVNCNKSIPLSARQF